MKAPGFDAQTQELRAEVVAARQALNNDRAERVDLSAGSVAPTAMPAPSSAGASPPSIAASVDAPPEPAGATAAVASAGGQVEGSAPSEAHGADVLGLVAGVDDDAAKLVAALKTALGSLNPETRAAIERETYALSDFAALFVDTPDDLSEVMTG